MTLSTAPTTDDSKKPRRHKVKYNRREAIAGYLFISPWILG
ncbi:MAG: hypothetical protein K0S70_4797, partial [Microbacterium sp.]|nr:hypothetical protein [Microbacterium sp.]